MEKYRYKDESMKSMEACPIPFAVYQFIDKRVVTIVLTKGFLDLFGFTDKAEAYDLMDHNMYRDTHPDDLAEISEEAIRFATEGGVYDVIYRTLAPASNGEYLLIHARGEHFYTETGVRLAVVWYTNEGVDSDELRSGSRQDVLGHSFGRMLREGSMVQRNNFDGLTGLPKMTYFFELAEAGKNANTEAGRPTSLLFFDLCGMRDFNRRYGFKEGDELLRAFSRMLVRYFSNENCCRIGQDHFIVYTGRTGIEKTLRDLFVECKQINAGKNLPVRVGVYTARGDMIETSEACDRAKMACERIRNRFFSSYSFFDDSLLAEAANRRHILDNFDKALEEEWIKVHYQPLIRAANGRVCGEEALARWVDPVRGFLSPADFIPILEESMLIYKLDLYVVKQTLKKMRRIGDAGLYVVPASVNLSRADFDSCDIVEEVRKLVDEAGIDHGLLNIEITESVIGSDFDYMKEQVERFRRLGFGVWMDDFGSGYSSLDVLQSIHFDVIKFDMRFMQQFDGTDKSKIILTELTRMATGLGIETVAEGVEEPEQVEFLRDIGCTMLQGFYYCRAIPLEEILKRYVRGVQIGFENPAETDYFTSIGAINLYDPAAIVNEAMEGSGHYFDTMPAAIMEVKNDAAIITRCNRTYREFMRNEFGVAPSAVPTSKDDLVGAPGHDFLVASIDCANDGVKRIVDESLGNGSTVHTLMRRINVNPVTGVAAIAVVVIGIVREEDRS